jgi:hypothetical protein
VKNAHGQDSLVKKTRKYIQEMGSTDAGITSEDQINMGITNDLTNKWGTYLVIVIAHLLTCLGSIDPGVIPMAVEGQGAD